MLKYDFQRIVDSFSAGKVISCEFIKKPLKIKAEIVNPITGKTDKLSGWLSLFELRTNHDQFILVGTTPNILDQTNLEKYLQAELNITNFEYISTSNKILITHKNDLHWYLLQPYKTLNRLATIKKISQLILNQKIHFIIGYGGVLFIEIGKLLKPRITWGSGEPYRETNFFVDEWWEIWEGKKKVASRFQDKAADIYIDKLNGQIIDDFVVTPSGQKTIIKIGKYNLIIYRTEELTTWDLTHRIQNYRLTLTGRKQFQIKDNIFEPPKKIKKRSDLFKLTVFDQFYKEFLPISHGNVRKILKSLIGAKIIEIRENTGISFCLELAGNDDWLISIDSSWQLYQNAKIILSSESHRFVFMEQLSSLLISNKITSLDFKKNLKETTFNFGGHLTLKVAKGKKLTSWTIFNRSKGIHLDVNSDSNFEHIIIYPDELKEKYLANKYGSKLANCLYALDFYRSLIVV